ncbi:hypothetical protein BT93_E1943 [Corymbia citriodora subsp. variegata]|nr:hypothetical protein BT93_E1943 [Corymbia citriodora subsp. variegata]
MENGDVGLGGRFSPKVLGFVQLAIEMEALDGLLEQWQRTGFLATEVTEKLSACSFM